MQQQQINEQLKILESSPGDVGALETLESFYGDQEQWAPLAKVLEESAQRVDSASRAVELYLRAAEIYRGRLQQDDRAERCLHRGLDRDADNRELLSALVALLEDRDRHAEVAEVLEHLVAVADDDAERARWLGALGELLDEKLDQPERALVALQAAFRADRSATDALRRGFLLYQRMHRYALAKEILDLLLEVAEGEESASWLAEQYAAIAREMLRSPSLHELAQDAIKQCVTLAPGHEGGEQIRQTLKEYAVHWEDHVRALRNDAMEARDKTLAAERYLAIAEHHWIYGASVEEAENFLDKAFLLVPGYWPAVQLLERLCRESGSVDHLVQKLGRMASDVTDVRAAVDMNLLLSVLEREAGADDDQVVARYEKILVLDATNRSAVTALTELFLGAGSVEQAALTQTRYAETVRDPEEKCAAYLAAATFLAELPDRQADAITHFEAALELGVVDEQGVIPALESLYLANGRHRELAALLQRRIDGTTDREQKLELYDRLYGIYHDTMSEPLPAFEAAAQAFLLDPVPAREQELERLADPLARLAELAEVYLDAAGRIASPAERVRVLLRTVELAGSVQRPNLAREALTQVLNLDPENDEALRALEGLEVEGADARTLAETLEARLAAAKSTRERRALLSRLGELYANELREAPRAIERYRALLELDAGDPEVLEQLDNLLRREERWRELVSVVEQRIAQSEEPDTAELQLRLAKIHEERLDQAELALDCYEKLHEAAPERLEIVAALERLLKRGVDPARVAVLLQPHYASVGAHRRQAEMIGVRRAALDDPRQRAALAREEGRIYEEVLHSPADAFRALASALLDEPDASDLPKELDRLASTAALHGEYAGVLERAIAALPESGARHTLEARRAAILESHLGDDDAAMEAHRNLLRQNPGNLASLDAMVSLLEKNGEFEELAQWLDIRRQYSAPEEQASVDLKLGTILVDHLGNIGQATTVLERARSTDDPGVREQVLIKLDEIFQQFNNVTAQRSVLEERLELAVGTERALVAARLGVLLASGGREPATAVKCFEQAMEADASNPMALTGLAGLLQDQAATPEVRADAARLLEPVYRSQDNDAGLVSVLRARLVTLEIEGERRALVAELCRLLAEELDEPDEALGLLEEHLHRDTSDAGALHLMEVLSLATGSLDRLYHVLLELLAAGGEGAEALGRRLVALATERQSPDIARRALEEMLRLNPEDAGLHDALVDLARSGEDPLTLAESLVAQMPTLAPELAVERALEAADCFNRAGATSRAEEVLRKNLLDHGFDQKVADRLALVLIQDERHEAVVEHWRDCLAQSTEQHRSAISLRLASALVGPLGRGGEAVEHLDTCLDGDPDRPEVKRALNMLDALAQDDGPDGWAAREALAKHFRRVGQFLALHEMLEKMAVGCEDLERRAALYDEITVLGKEQLEDPHLAYAAASRALRSYSTAERLEVLRNLALAGENFEGFAAVLEEVAELHKESDPSRAVPLLHEAALVHGEHLGDRANRIRLLQYVLALAPGDAAALEALEAVHRESAEIDQLIDVLRQKVETTADGAERNATRLQIGRLLIESGAQFEEAIKHLQQLVLEQPEAEEACDLLETAFARVGDHGRLADLLQARLDRATGASLRGAIATRLGRVRLQQDRRAEALAVLQLAVAEAPGDPTLAAVLGEFAEIARRSADPVLLEVARAQEVVLRAMGATEDLPPVLETLLQTAESAHERQRYQLEIAHIQEAVLQQPAIAFMTACKALREQPGDLETLERVEQLARRSNSEEELVDVLEEMLESVPQQEVQALLHRRIAQLMQATDQDGGAVLSHLEAAHMRSPEDLGTAEELVRLGRSSLVSAALASALQRVATAESIGGRVDRAKELWLEAAEVHEELGEIESAVQSLEAILEVDPVDFPGLRSLDRLYEKLQRPRELGAILEREIELAPGVQQRAELLVRLTKHRRIALLDPVGAAQAAERVAKEFPTVVGIAEELESVFRELGATPGPDAIDARARIAKVLALRYDVSGEVEKLVEVLEVQLLSLSDPADRRATFLRLAKLRGKYLGQTEGSYDALARALQEAPTDGELRGAVERAASETGDLDGLVGLFEKIAQSVDSDETALDYRRRIATLCRGPLNDYTRAVVQYEHVLKLLGPAAEDSTERRQVRLQVLDSIEEVARAAEAWDTLSTALRRRQQLDLDANRRHQAAIELVQILLHKLDDATAALQLARTMVEGQPDDIEALHLAAGACEGLGRHEELVEILEQLAQREPEQEQRLQHRFRLASVLDEKLGRGDDAMAHFTRILEESPGHTATRIYLEDRLESARGGRSVSIDALESAYGKTGDWNKAIEVLEGQLQDVQRMGQQAEARMLLMRIAEIHSRELDSPELAFATLGRAFKLDPTDQDVRERLSTQARELEMLDDLAEMFEEEAGAAQGMGLADVATGLLEAAAALFAFELDQGAKGLALFEQVLVSHPGRLATLAGLDRLYGELQRYDQLELILRQRLAVCDEVDERVSLLHRLGVCLVDHLDRTAEAVGALEEVLDLDPAHVEARLILADIYTDVGRTDDLRRVLESLLADAESRQDRSEQIRLHTLLGRMLIADTGTREVALRHWEFIVEADPENQEAHGALEDLYTATEKYAELRDLLERQLRITSDETRRDEITSRLGLLLAEHLGDAETAIERFESVLERDPRNREALQSLRRVYRKAGRFDDLVGVLRILLGLQADTGGIKQVRFELAEVLGTELARHADAVKAGRRVLEVVPHTEEELARLEAIFRACEAWTECVEVLEYRLGLVKERAPREALLRNIAELWEENIGRPEEATSAYERVLEIDPADAAAYATLCTIYETGDAWDRLVRLKETRVHALEEKEERITLLKEIGGIYEERLGQKDLAFLAACRAFREDVYDTACGQWMEKLALESDSVEELIDVYEDEVQRVGDEERCIAIYLRMANLAITRMEDLPAAQSYLEKVFEYDAENREALDQLNTILLQQGQFEAAVGVLERKVRASTDLQVKIELLLEVAGIYEEKIEQHTSAADVYKRILELDGTHSIALSRLSQLYQTMDRPQALIGVLQRALDAEEDQDRRLELRFQIAGIWENEIEDADQAIAAYRAVLDVNPAHTPSLKALEGLYDRLDRMSELLGVYEKQVALAATTAAQVVLLRQIAEIWRNRFDNVEQAVAATERILLVEPSNTEALHYLEDLFRQSGNWLRLIDILRQHIELIRNTEEEVQLYLEVGNIYYRELNQIDRAEEMYGHALERDPKSRQAIHALGQLYERSGNWFNALEKLGQEVELVSAEPEVVDLHLRMGKINEDMLLDTQSARASYERALDLDPGYLPAIRALKEIHLAGKEYDEYLRCLLLEAEHVEDTEETTELFTLAGRFLQERSGDLSGAVPHYESALAQTPTHLPAAIPLADIEYRREHYDRARELLEVVVSNYEVRDDPGELVRFYYRLGYVNQKLDSEDAALDAYRQAYDLDPSYMPVLEGYGQALVQAAQYEEAQKVYQTLLLNHHQDLPDAEVVDYYWQLGDICKRLEQNERAQRSFEKALEHDPAHVPSLRDMAEILEHEGAYEDAFDTYSQLTGYLIGSEKVEKLLHLGAMSRDKLHDPYRAIDAYEDARGTDGRNKEILEALYELYDETRQAPKVAEILEELILVEPDEKARVRLNFAAGEIYRDDLKNHAKAIQYFNAALDLEPTYYLSFKAIEDLLNQLGQWKTLEENYVAMIQRTSKDNVKVRGVLWNNLAELYYKKLNMPEAAVEAFLALRKIQPDNNHAREVRAELLAKLGKIDTAIADYQELVPRSERPAKACHALCRLYLARKLHDRAYCALSALQVLGDVDAEEQKLYGYYFKNAPVKAQRALTERLWEAMLVHDKARGPLTTIAAILYRKAAGVLLEDPKALHLNKKREWERVDASRYFVTQLKYVHNVLNVGAFDLYQRKKSDSVLSVLPTPRPILWVGEHNEVFREVPPRQIWFVAARTLTYLRPPYILPFLLGPVEFLAAMEAALKLVEPRFQGRSNAEDIARYGKRLQRVPDLTEALRPVLKQILSEGRRPDVKAYCEGIEYTAIRAATLVTCDVGTSVQMLRAKDPGHVQVAHAAKLRALVDFLVSEQHFELRARLGMAVKGQGS